MHLRFTTNSLGKKLLEKKMGERKINALKVQRAAALHFLSPNFPFQK